MLRTNTRKAKENIKQYIIDNFDPSNYSPETEPKTFTEIAKFIYNVFTSEYYSTPADKKYHRTEQNAFGSWCAGLPTVLDTCYFYNRSAVEDLAKILEQNDNEKSKYTETEAELTLTYLIYREIKNEVTK